MSWWWWLGLIVAIIALLLVFGFLLFILGFFIVAVPWGIWQQWREEKRRVWWTAPGLGEFTSTDGEYWSGEVQDLTVIFMTGGGPPALAQLEAFRSLQDQLPSVSRLAIDFLNADDEVKLELEELKERGEFRLYGLEVEDADRFTAMIEHTADLEFGFYVTFIGGKPDHWSGMH